MEGDCGRARKAVIGILVHGSNHFIVEGPLPDLAAARKLVRLWEMPRLLESAPAMPWRVLTRAFRENLEWAVALEGDTPIQANVSELLDEVRARDVEVRHGPGPLLAAEGAVGWPGRGWPDLVA